MNTKYMAILMAAIFFSVFSIGVASANASSEYYGSAPSGILFEGFGDLIQLMETYRTLIIIIGGILFVVGIILIIFPGGKAFLGSWFSS